MPNMTLALPKDLHRFVKQHKEVNWSEVARQAMRKHAKKLELMDELAKHSKLTEADVDELDHIIKQAVRQRTEE